MFDLCTPGVGVFALCTPGVGVCALCTPGVGVFDLCTPRVGVFDLCTPGVGVSVMADSSESGGGTGISPPGKVSVPRSSMAFFC